MASRLGVFVAVAAAVGAGAARAARGRHRPGHAGLAGLPPHAVVTVVVTLLLAGLQVLAGAWLARAPLPRKAVGRTRAL